MLSVVVTLGSFNAKLYGLRYFMYQWFYTSFVMGVSTILAFQAYCLLVTVALILYTCLKHFVQHEPGAPQTPLELVLFIVHWAIRFIYNPQQQVDILQRRVDVMQQQQRPKHRLPASDRAQIQELSDDEGVEDEALLDPLNSHNHGDARGFSSIDSDSSEDLLSDSRRNSIPNRIDYQEHVPGGILSDPPSAFANHVDEKNFGGDSKHDNAFSLLRRRHKRGDLGRSESSDGDSGTTDQLTPMQTSPVKSEHACMADDEQDTPPSAPQAHEE